MAWLLLIIAGLTEIVWAIGLKEANGFTELVPSIITIVFLVVSFFVFAKAMKTIPIGTAYAIFTGIGAAGTVIVGILWFHEEVSFGKLFFLGVLLFGIIGLKLVDDEEEVA
ncbi:DMT family transporter [Psychrobacillus lasiicapitis]|uniref:Multidrug efflux SMR transporter n=1 Tax=Psychrobacillus lasiicapitis TaxID=1636719 RepID=A0A544T5D4_9BACI|nr:multidrug efflux SMR transporter [Psychrobacillus lasiicapitis]TQR12663.1 multidrug efflux SMR transporter [Psychrobacillus lasiicapitis]GGA39930.1 QacE family quaternary ammonium compound efflux SMR transporter [Psychrobacillus lasiicapitis]